MTAVQTPLVDTPTTPVAGAPLLNSRNVRMSVVLFCAALLTLFALQLVIGISPFGVSPAPHYIYQAMSFLHGRWYLTPPEPLFDTIRLHGKVYAVYPPFPALVMLPFVALFGAHTSDILITAVLSALNLPLLYLLFEQAQLNGLTRRSPRENLIISMLLYFGSINLYLSLGGEVWFTAQIICMTCALMSLLLAFRRHFGWSAALLGCAFFSRGTMALGFPLMLYLAWQDGGSEPALEQFARSIRRRCPEWSAIPWSRLAAPLAVCVGMVALFLLRNTLEFGSPLESGFGIQMRQNYPGITHGLYSLAYVPRNLMVNFFDFPRVTFANPYALNPILNLVGDGMGISVFVTTPLFLFLFSKNTRISPLRIALHLTIALFVIETLLYSWTGYNQFGARYLFDAYPFAFLLLALNERRVDWRFVLLGLFALPINAMGARQIWT